jgi:two-component system cell cycle response regulator
MLLAAALWQWEGLVAPDDEIPSGGLLDLDDLSETTMKLTLPRQNRAKRMTIPTLRVVAGPDMLSFCSLSAGEELLTGRDENCGLSLSDVSVSRYHARLSSSANGEVMVQDLGSTNGTAINARSTRRGILRPGDHLEIGAVSLRLDMLGLDELAHLARIQERLNAADRDPLTGLMARNFLNEGMPLLVDRCSKANVPIAAIFMDLDNFGKINKVYQHHIGDQVLQTTARLILLGIRDSDPCVRYGGEELLILLPGASEKAAHEVAERIRRSIAGHDWERSAPGLRVTSSVGIAEKKAEDTAAEWLIRADAAMLHAKANGKNRSTCASKIEV